MTYKDGFTVVEAADATPARGGQLTFAGLGEPRSLDPAVTIAAGTTGGVEMLNIYDSLTRYDVATASFVPQLAESVETADGGVTWTVELREGLRFTDGSPLDAAAVKRSQERYVATPGPEAGLWAANVEKVAAAGGTVTYTLRQPWMSFPSALSTGPGMIVADSSGSGEEFKPVGAGPFLLDRWAPQEQLVLKANPDYWAGAPALESLRFVYMPHQQASLDSLESGEVDMALVTDPEKVDPLIEAGAPAYVSMVGVGSMVLVNASEGRAGADPRVRQAMAMAVAPEAVSSRAYGGKALASTTMFPDYSRWHTATAGPKSDPDRARELVKEAKADGFDGTLVYRSVNDPGARNSALAAKASLEAVGFKVELDFARDIGQLIGKVAVEKDYDLAKWGLNYRDADPFSKMYATLHSAGGQGFGMATSPELDGLLLELQGATADAQGVAVMDKIQQEINELVPFLNFGPFAEVITWNDDVHGITGSGSTMVLFDKAWLRG